MDRIEKKLKDVGLSASAASLAAGLSKDAIRNIRRAKSQGIDVGVNIRTVEALAPVLKTSKAWLLGEDDSPEERFDGGIPLFGIEELPDRRPEILAGRADAARGARSVHLPRVTGTVVAIRLADHSMSQIIPRDSIVLVDLFRVARERRAVYVLATGDGGVVLRMYEDNPGRFVPASVVPGFQSYFDLDAVEVIGRAVATFREL